MVEDRQVHCLFIAQQFGQIFISDGTRVTATFLDIREQVSCCSGESGFYDVAFHPDFKNNGFFYVSYSDTSDDVGDLIISRFIVSANPNFADSTSEQIILRVDQASNVHQAGHIEFGPDGFLYISLGDGGPGSDRENHGQRLDTLLGSIVRIDVDGGDPYAVPATNPFVNVLAARGEIWAYGLRNPWRFGFDQLTGDLFIADVGGRTREEINFQPASSGGGENYGWRIMEGNTCRLPDEGCGGEPLTPPVLEYRQLPPESHQGMLQCWGAVIGGYPYRGSAFPQLTGVYFYGDYCMGLIDGALRVNGSWLELPPRQTDFCPTSFGQDEAGELYVADRCGGGTVYRIVSDPSTPVLSPEVSPGGVVSAATFNAGEGLAPGSAASVFGTELAAVPEAASARPSFASTARSQPHCSTHLPNRSTSRFHGNSKVRPSHS